MHSVAAEVAVCHGTVLEERQSSIGTGEHHVEVEGISTHNIELSHIHPLYPTESPQSATTYNFRVSTKLYLKSISSKSDG